MRRTKDTINGTVDWDASSEEAQAFIWCVGITVVCVFLFLSVAAYNIAYVIYTPPEIRQVMERR